MVAPETKIIPCGRNAVKSQMLDVSRAWVAPKVGCGLAEKRLQFGRNRRRLEQIHQRGLTKTAKLPQCRKWRMPVKTMARPSRSAAAMTSGSRTEPPGWITAVAPAFADSST